MNAHSMLLQDMDKAITDMEVALAVIKPEFRAARATTLVAGPTPSPGGQKSSSSGSKKEDKKLRKERKDRERVERRAARAAKEEAKALGGGKTSKKPPAPSRHHSDPILADLPKQVDLALLGAGAVPLAVASGSGDLLSPASAQGSQRERSGTVGSSSGKHKGLKSIFRKSSHGSRTPTSPNVVAVAVAVHPPISPPLDLDLGPSRVTPVGVPVSPISPATPSGFSVSRQSYLPPPVDRAPPSPAPSTFPQDPLASAQGPPSTILSDLWPAIDQLNTSLNNLRAMHSTLLEDSRRSGAQQDGLSDFERYQLRTIGREPSDVGTLRGDTQIGTAEDDRLGALRTHQRAASTSSRLSSVLSVWFDAEVMPELDELAEDEAAENEALARVGIPEEGDSSSDSEEEEEYEDVEDYSEQLTPPSRSTPFQRTNSFASSNFTTSTFAPSSFSGPSVTRNSYDTARPEDSFGRRASAPAPSSAPSPVVVDEPRVEWRTTLPVPMPKDEGSLISVLRKSVGKDMAQISMPVTFNEAISLLQRSAEDLEYSNLLTLAAHALDSTERLSHIAAFAVSSYAGARYRSSRKPFNPMLGETFEFVRDSVRFIAEKTSHHPPIIASHADGPGWTMDQTSSAKNKLAGMSLEITPVGATYVTLDRTGERYTWTKPSSYIRNLVAGTKYVETIGKMEVTNLTTSETCRLTFKEGGWGGGGRNVVSGIVMSASGSKVAWIDGKWDSKLDIKYGPHDPAHLLWQTNPWPADCEKYYGWTYFTIGLNQLDPAFSHLLPSSDSRFNPSQRALEEGQVDLAESYKLALETKQRARNKAREEKGDRWEPKFFKKDGEGYVYKGGYWEARQDGTFEDLDLW